MTINKKELQIKALEKLNDNYEAQIIDTEYITFKSNKKNINIKFSFRIQFYNRISFEGFTISLNEIESKIFPLISKDLNSFYNKYFGVSYIRFYKPKIEFSLYEINNEEDINIFLSQVIQCVEYHHQVIFPKLLDINYLAEYVGSVPFERQSEIPVGGKFPAQLFKKLAILKWGNQEERYHEYKTNTIKLIEKYEIKKPESYKPFFKTGYDNLIQHLESETNPFKINIG